LHFDRSSTRWGPFEKRIEILPPKFGEKRRRAEKFANKRERLGANRIRTSLYLSCCIAALTISYLCRPHTAIISALLNLNTPFVYVYIRKLLTDTHTHGAKTPSRAASEPQPDQHHESFLQRAPNEKKKIMNGCCCCFFSSSISFFRHASLESVAAQRCTYFSL
jgi:hypothetical protein